jgi:glycosyltransferase involved in cell wall biosynthesis
MASEGGELSFSALSRRGLSLKAPGELRILIDGRKLGDGGIGVYIDNLVKGLLGLRRQTVRVQQAVGDNRTWPQDSSERLIAGIRLGVVVRRAAAAGKSGAPLPSWSNQVEIIEDPSPHYSWDEMVRLPRRLPWQDYDVFHAPHFMLPFAVPLPTVVTLHDLIHVQHPERPYYPMIAQFLIRSALRRATRVITVSQATYHDIRRLVGESSRVLRSVRVISNALDPFFLEPSLDRASVTLAGSKRPYMLSILSNAKPHKGIEDLLAAWEQFKRNLSSRSGDGKAGKGSARIGPRLLIAGLGTDRLADNSPLLSRLAARDDVILLGPVSKEQLRAWYQSAECVVIPSRAEGFGLPVIEAHASGAPVVVRPVPALLEIVSPGDQVAADMSVEALAKALGQMWDSLYSSTPDSSDTLATAAAMTRRASLREQTAARFDLIDVARATLDVYQDAVREIGR